MSYVIMIHVFERIREKGSLFSQSNFSPATSSSSRTLILCERFATWSIQRLLLFLLLFLLFLLFVFLLLFLACKAHAIPSHLLWWKYVNITAPIWMFHYHSNSKLPETYMLFLPQSWNAIFENTVPPFHWNMIVAGRGVNCQVSHEPMSNSLPL